MMCVTLLMKRLKKLHRVLRTLISTAAPRGALLAQFLNNPAKHVDYVRVAQVFGFCQQLSTLQPNSSLAANTRRAINAHLSELQVVPVLQANGNWDWRAGHPGNTPKTEVSPAFALKVIADLDSDQMLQRLRQCQACEKWFFAPSNKKIFCGDACRSEKFKRDSQTFKNDRAEYMRRYRKTRELPGVKRKWTKETEKPNRSR
jgi:hypothetical protein